MRNELEVMGPARLYADVGDEFVWHVRSGERHGVVVTGVDGVSDEPLVRIQSSCLFSESLGAIDCDCASQLETARRNVIEQRGILLYLFEEGRGAGLNVKMQAIMLQQELGIGTGAAYDRLGLRRDVRSYDFAAQVLERFTEGRPIRLLTNNPSRLEGLVETGANVLKSVPLVIRRPETVGYLADKATSLGHEV